MNPNWIVIRERPWLTPGPLKTGAAEVTCYGLHVRVRSTGRIRLTASYPDSTILHKDTGPADVWPDLLDWLATLAPKKGEPQVYVWLHGLADHLPTLMGEARVALTYAPSVRIEGSTVIWETVSVDPPPNQANKVGGMLCLTERNTRMTLSRLCGTSHRVNVVAGRLSAASCTFGSSRPVHLADSRAYFRDELTEPTMAAFVTGLATLDRTTRERRALHPATAARLLGDRIAGLWTLLDVAPSPTPASAAARVFRRHYLPAALAPVPTAVEEAARLSFHGGKVGCWVPNRPTEVTHVEILDMQSAYGWALCWLPAFLQGRWRPFSWKRGDTTTSALGTAGDPLKALLMPRPRGKDADRELRMPGLRKSDVFRVPGGGHPVGGLRPPLVWRGVRARPGFVCVSGQVAGDRWPCVQDHAGRWVDGRASRLWLSTFEVVEAVERGELRLDGYTAWLWDGDDESESPWRRFALDMFRRRDLATDETRAVYKAALVGLYGKTIQRSPVPPADIPEGVGLPWGRRVVTLDRGGHRVDAPTYWRASATYYPVVASLVTAMVRVAVHQAEHATEAVHTATDAVHAVKPMPDEMVGRGMGYWNAKGGGRGFYGRSNLWQVRGPGGRRWAAASGVQGDPLAITDDLVGVM